jgi:hypothetical protein
MGKMEDLRGALAASLSSLSAVQESAYILSNPTPPSVEVQPGPIHYDLAMQRGWDEWMFTVRMFVSLTSDIGSQKLLDSFMDPTGDQSVKTLIEADRTLGGACDFVLVTECSGYQTFQSTHTGKLSLGTEWTVQVHVSN